MSPGSVCAQIPHAIVSPPFRRSISPEWSPLESPPPTPLDKLNLEIVSILVASRGFTEARISPREGGTGREKSSLR